MKELIRFGLVGALATALHYGIYYVLWRFAHANESIAYTVGYALSFVANFYLTAYFTFRSRPSWKRAGGFGGAHLVNYLLHISLLNLFLWLGTGGMGARSCLCHRHPRQLPPRPPGLQEETDRLTASCPLAREQ